MGATTAVQPEAEDFVSANDRWKHRFRSWFWSSMILATVLHFGLFALWPEMTAPDVSFAPGELETIELPPEIEIPPPPAQLARPATPIVAQAQLDEDITIAPTTFEKNPVERLPPPIQEERPPELSDTPVFTPYTVAPRLLNREKVREVLLKEYPSLLRAAGIGGTVRVYVFIDGDGVVQNAEVNESSGQGPLDEAALKVAQEMEFTPALNMDIRVPVWIAIPIQFEVGTLS